MEEELELKRKQFQELENLKDLEREELLIKDREAQNNKLKELESEKEKLIRLEKERDEEKERLRLEKEKIQAIERLREQERLKYLEEENLKKERINEEKRIEQEKIIAEELRKAETREREILKELETARYRESLRKKEMEKTLERELMIEEEINKLKHAKEEREIMKLMINEKQIEDEIRGIIMSKDYMTPSNNNKIDNFDFYNKLLNQQINQIQNSTFKNNITDYNNETNQEKENLKVKQNFFNNKNSLENKQYLINRLKNLEIDEIEVSDDEKEISIKNDVIENDDKQIKDNVIENNNIKDVGKIEEITKEELNQNINLDKKENEDLNLNIHMIDKENEDIKEEIIDVKKEEKIIEIENNNITDNVEHNVPEKEKIKISIELKNDFIDLISDDSINKNLNDLGSSTNFLKYIMKVKQKRGLSNMSNMFTGKEKNNDDLKVQILNLSGSNFFNTSFNKLSKSVEKNNLANTLKQNKNYESDSPLKQSNAFSLYNINPKYEATADKKALLLREEQIKNLEDIIKSKDKEIECLEDIIKDNSLEKNQLFKTRDALMKELEDKHDEILLLREEKEVLLKKVNNLKRKNQNLVNDLENIENLKSEIEDNLMEKRQRVKYLEEDKMKLLKENEELNSLIDNYKIESINHKNENLSKAERISNLQNKIIDYEQEIFDLKTRANSEMAPLKDAKNNFETLKSSYYELKNQNELLNVKHQSVLEEIYSLKRNQYLVENESKNRLELIERYRSEIISLKKKLQYQEEENNFRNSKLKNAYDNLFDKYDGNNRDILSNTANYDNLSKNSSKEKKTNFQSYKAPIKSDKEKEKRTFSRLGRETTRVSKEKDNYESNEKVRNFSKLSNKSKESNKTEKSNNYEEKRKAFNSSKIDNFNKTSKNFSRLTNNTNKNPSIDLNGENTNNNYSTTKDDLYNPYKKDENFNKTTSYFGKNFKSSKKIFVNKLANLSSFQSKDFENNSRDFNNLNNNQQSEEISFEPMSNYKPVDNNHLKFMKKASEVQKLLDDLYSEKNSIINKLAKIPQFPKKINQIEEKNYLEKDLSKLQLEIAHNKKELREANQKIKTF
jgi:hypothetical protein